MLSPVTSKVDVPFGHYFIYYYIDISTYSTQIDGDGYKLITLQNIYLSNMCKTYFGT